MGQLNARALKLNLKPCKVKIILVYGHEFESFGSNGYPFSTALVWYVENAVESAYKNEVKKNVKPVTSQQVHIFQY